MGGQCFYIFSCRIRISAERAFQVEKAAMRTVEYQKKDKRKGQKGRKHMAKREGYISWDEYFMAVAQLAGMRSKDPGTQVGCCIVSKDNKILSMGYNGFPKGCSDDVFPWEREGEMLTTKYAFCDPQ